MENLENHSNKRSNKQVDHTRKAFSFKNLPSISWKAAKIWYDNEPWRLGAVVAYYAILALPGLLVIIINSVGAIWGVEIVQGEITGHISEVIGPDTAESVVTIVENTQTDQRTLSATVIGIIILVIGATGVFYQLQISMNKIWNVQPSPDAGIFKLVKDRAISFAFILVIAFLLIVSLVVSTALSVLSDYLQVIWEPGIIVLAQTLDIVISTLVIGLLFVLIFKYMPDMKISWKSVWLGGFITAILFNIGIILLSLYFGEAEPGSTYGAAGSVVLILLWVSYSCLILFYGTAFTRVYAEEHGHNLQPKEHAIRVELKEVSAN